MGPAGARPKWSPHSRGGGCSSTDPPFTSPLLGLTQRAYINTIALLFGERVHLDEIRVPHDYRYSELVPASPTTWAIPRTGYRDRTDHHQRSGGRVGVHGV